MSTFTTVTQQLQRVSTANYIEISKVFIGNSSRRDGFNQAQSIPPSNTLQGVELIWYTPHLCCEWIGMHFSFNFIWSINLIHSVSSNRDNLIGTQLVSLEKVGESSLFGGKYKGQNSLFLAFLWVFMQWNHRILPKRYISVSFLDKNKGQVLV